MDIEAKMGYSKIIEISKLARKLREQGKTKDEIMQEIVKFRKEHGWDK